MNTVRVAVIQDAPCAFDTPATVEKAIALIAAAGAQGAQLAVLPEAFVGGYPKGADFGARVGSRTREGREWFRRYALGAIDVPGPVTQVLGAEAGRHGMAVVAGVIERDAGTLYCTALYFDADGALLGKHRKVMPTAMERLIWGFGDGSTLGVHETRAGKVAAAICWENYMPALRMAYYAQGVQLYCAPTVDDRDAWIPTMQHVAYEGRCFVLSACQFARRADYPADYPSAGGGAPADVLIRGGSCIVSPFGEVLAGPVYNQSALLTADVDLGEIARGKYDLDVTGHYARPDIFGLQVNSAPQRAVTFE